MDRTGQATAWRGLDPRLVVVLALLNAVNPLATDMFLAAFPTMARDLHTSPAAVQLTLTTYMVGMACGQLVVGPISDSLGRRRPLLVGTCLCLVASVACALAPTIEALVAARLVQGFSGAAGVVLARAVISDLTRGAHTARMMNLMMIIGALAPVFGPVVGGAIFTTLGWRAVLWAVALAVAVMVLGASFVVPESLPPERRHGGELTHLVRGMRSVLARRVFLGYALTGVFAFGTLFAYISASSFVVQEVLGLDSTAFTLVFGANALSTTLVSALSMRLVSRVPVRRLLDVGVTWLVSGCVVLVLLVLVAGTPVVPFLIALTCTLAAFGMVMGNASALAVMQVRDRAGSGSAVQGTLQFAMAGAVSPLVGLGGGAAVMVLVMLGCASLAALSFVVIARRADRDRDGVDQEPGRREPADQEPGRRDLTDREPAA